MLYVGMIGCKVKPEKFASMIDTQADAWVRKIWDPDFEKAKKAAENISNETKKPCDAVEDVSEIIGDEKIGGVVIITENCQRAELVIAAANAGKHIFVEKPMCLISQDAERIRAAVNANNVKFYMSDPFVAAPTAYVKQAIADGIIGTPINASIIFNDYYPDALSFRDDNPGSDADGDVYKNAISNAVSLSGGGLMSDTGGHMLHLANFLFGMPEEIKSRFKFRDKVCERYGWEDECDMILEYKDGFYVHIFCSRLIDSKDCYMDVCGTEGSIYDLGSFSHGKNYLVMHKKNGDKNWTLAKKAEMGPDPIRHVLYWLKMIREDISQEEFDADPLGNCGVNIDKAVELIKMREMIYGLDCPEI